MVNKRRFCAVLLAALIVFAMAASLLFIAHEAGHRCTGNDCPICEAIALCGNALKTLSAAFVALAALLPACVIALFVFAFRRTANAETPVSLKVRSLN